MESAVKIIKSQFLSGVSLAEINFKVSFIILGQLLKKNLLLSFFKVAKKQKFQLFYKFLINFRKSSKVLIGMAKKC